MQLSPFVEQVTPLFTVLSGLGVVGAAFAVGHKTGYRSAKKTLNSERNLKRFTEIYAPLATLFITYHITWAQWSSRCSFQERLVNARKKLTRRFRLKEALFALFTTNTVEATYCEIEYGGEFPLLEITSIIRNKAEFADPRLVDLVGRSHLSKNKEKPKTYKLTEADWELVEYIQAEYKKLGRRFVQA